MERARWVRDGRGHGGPEAVCVRRAMAVTEGAHAAYFRAWGRRGFDRSSSTSQPG
jgi:hypothetical protein